MSATTSSFRETYLKARYRFSLAQVVAELLQKRWMDALVPFLVMVVVVTTFTQLIPNYTSADNLINTGREFGEFGFLVLALTLVVIGGGIDLSIGAIFAISDLVALITFVYLKWPLAVVIPVTLLSGGLLASFNGLLIGFLRTRAFLTTLVTMIIFRAGFDIVGQKYSSELMAGGPANSTWDWLGSGAVFGIPSNMFVLILVAIVGHIFLSRSRPGWHLTAIGAGRRAARHAGIGIEKTLFWTYVGSGVLCAIGGLFYAARLASAGSDTGLNSEIVAITAVVLGGVSLGGGKGSIGRAMIGATTVLVLTNGVVRLGVVGGMSSVVLGATLLLAVAIDVHWAKHRHKAIARLYVVPTYLDLPKGQSTEAGPFTPNTRLAASEAIGLDMVDGPEDVIIDRQGRLYAGVRQGWILRFSGPNFENREVFARPGGRPLGMAFDKDDNLIVCIAGMGLYGIHPDGSIFKLSDETNRSWNKINDDSRLRLADDLDIGPDGKVYFSEATIRYDIHSWATDALEGRGNGRIIEYDPATKKTRTIIKNVSFPNGICMSHDGKSFLYAQTWANSISRYWTEGPKKGTVDVLIADLPGYPDNINRSSDGKYWLALVGMRTPTLDLAMKFPDFRTRMVKQIAPDEWLFPNINNGCVCKFDDDGKVSESLWDQGGTAHPTITSMREDRGHLYIGGLYNNRIGRIALPATDASWNGVESYWGKK